MNIKPHNFSPSRPVFKKTAVLNAKSASQAESVPSDGFQSSAPQSEPSSFLGKLARGVRNMVGPSEHSETVEERFHQLDTLARSLSGELGTKIVPADKWQHTFLPGGQHEIKFNEADLKDKPVDYALGKVLSEAAKARYSHWVLEPEMAANEEFMSLYNAVETARTQTLLSDRFPGAPTFLDDVYEADLKQPLEAYQKNLADELARSSEGKLSAEEAMATARESAPTLPRHLQFANAIMEDALTGEVRSELDPEMAELFKENRGTIRESYELQRSVAHRDLNLLESRRQASESAEKVKNDLWPLYQSLLKKDRQDLENALQGNSSGEGSSGSEKGSSSKKSENSKGGNKAGESGESKESGAGQGEAQKQAGEGVSKAGESLEQSDSKQAREAAENLKQAGEKLQEAGQASNDGERREALEKAAEQLKESARKLGENQDQKPKEGQEQGAGGAQEQPKDAQSQGAAGGAQQQQKPEDAQKNQGAGGAQQQKPEDGQNQGAGGAQQQPRDAQNQSAGGAQEQQQPKDAQNQGTGGAQQQNRQQQSSNSTSGAGQNLNQAAEALEQAAQNPGRSSQSMAEAARQMQQAGKEMERKGRETGDKAMEQAGKQLSQAGRDLAQHQPEPSNQQPGQPGHTEQTSGAPSPGQSKESLPKLTPEEAESLAERVSESMAKERNNRLETEQKDARREKGQKLQQERVKNRSNSFDQSGADGQNRDTDLSELLKQKLELQKKFEAIHSDYDVYHSKVARMSDTLAGELGNFLHRNSEPEYARPFRKSGKKLDIKQAMRSQAKFERTGVYDPNVWLRRTNPEHRNFEFVFLLDQSGSMGKEGAEKWDNSVLGLIMAGEALQQLEIPFGVIGFSNGVRVHKDLNENYEEKREDVLSNIKGYGGESTRDDRGLETALDLLKNQGRSDAQKVVVVLSDGEGQSDNVRKLLAGRAEDEGVHVIGLGIGAGTDFVKEVYEQSLVIAQLDQMPLELSYLIREQIEGVDEY